MSAPDLAFPVDAYAPLAPLYAFWDLSPAIFVIKEAIAAGLSG